MLCLNFELEICRLCTANGPTTGMVKAHSAPMRRQEDSTARQRNTKRKRDSTKRTRGESVKRRTKQGVLRMLEGSTSSRSTARENEMSRWVETLEALDKASGPCLRRLVLYDSV